MFVCEQPGNEEDLAGRPFVGPAGRLFDKALLAAGIDRASVYVTNAVKHFKNEPPANCASTRNPTARRSSRVARGSKPKSQPWIPP